MSIFKNVSDRVPAHNTDLCLTIKEKKMQYKRKDIYS